MPPGTPSTTTHARCSESSRSVGEDAAGEGVIPRADRRRRERRKRKAMIERTESTVDSGPERLEETLVRCGRELVVPEPVRLISSALLAALRRAAGFFAVLAVLLGAPAPRWRVVTSWLMPAVARAPANERDRAHRARGGNGLVGRRAVLGQS
jgi:hypothetical protein